MKKIAHSSGTFVQPDLSAHLGERIWIHGSIYKIRRMSGFAFVLLRTAREIIQCIYDENEAHFLLSDLQEEACVRFIADIVPDSRARKGYEPHLIDMEILSIPKDNAPFAINHKVINTSLDSLLHFRPLTLRNEKERAIFKLQEGIVYGFRRYLSAQNFTEVHTPKLVGTGAEGGANIFHLDYFGKEAFLAQSPQFYKQMLVGVFERVYEIAPVFRAERHDTAKHLNEYTSVDLEMGYVTDFKQLMELETDMLSHMLAYLKEEYIQELSLLKVTLPTISAIPAISFKEAKQTVSTIYHRPIKDMQDLEPEEEKLLSEWILKETGSEFVFVTHYPSAKRPFYTMDDPLEPDVTLSFDLLFRGLEVTTGGQRIHNFDMQIEKMLHLGLPVESFESYLNAHRYGLPPHGGLGLGLERFTSRLLRQDNVRLASLFPRDIKRITP